MSKKLILESRFTNHQKTHIILTIGGLPLIVIIYSIVLGHNSTHQLITAISTIIYIVLICLAFTKKGLFKKGETLYRGLFFNKKIILCKKFDLTDKSKVSILKFRKTQKMAWFSDAKPDLGTNFISLDITLLNNKHTQKELLISLRKENKSKRTIEFLNKNFNLKEEIYSPDFR